uniref:threonine--tRNA ligase n=1 Tax=Acrobeloides nanus TaxID=290746 RepID=A0A914CH47_9BILA
MQKYKEEVAQKTSVPIKITLSDGEIVNGNSWKTTPYEVAEKISKWMAENAVIAKVNGELWDLDRPFEGDATLQILNFDDDEGKQVFWHSSAHIVGEAVERYCGGHLCDKPPIYEGFYYDMYKDDLTISQEDFPKLEEIAKLAIKVKL